MEITKSQGKQSGQIALAVVVLVVVVSTVVIGYLFYLMIQKLAPGCQNQLTNDVEGEISAPTGTVIGDFQLTQESINTPMLVSGNPITITYWFSTADANLHVMPGLPLTNWMGSSYTGIIATNRNDSNCVDVTFESLGSPARSIVDCTTNDRCFPIFPVIYRSTNLVDWTALYTNQEPPLADTNYTFTDNQPPAPPVYYRVGYNTNFGLINQ